jgi:hypothetical protein
MKAVHCLLPVLLLLALPSLLAAQKPLGNEFQVNDPAARQSGDSRVATNASGELVVTWVGTGPLDGPVFVYARRYGADGRPATGPITVTHTLGRANKQVVAMMADGSFVVAYTDRGTGEESILRARWYSPAGVLQGQAVVTRELVVDLAIANRGDGRLVLAWTSVGPANPANPTAVRARIFGPDRSPLGREILVDPLGSFPAVAMGHAGEIVMAWLHDNTLPAPALHDFFEMRRFAADGTPAGPALAVSPLNEAGPLDLFVGKDGDGNFLLAEDGTFETWGKGTFLRRFRADGTPLGGILRLDLDVRSMSMGPRGNFVVSWREPLAVGSRESFQIFARRFAANGRPLGPDVPVSADTPGTRFLGQVAIGADGGFVVAWDSDQREEFHGDVFARRFQRR